MEFVHVNDTNNMGERRPETGMVDIESRLFQVRATQSDACYARVRISGQSRDWAPTKSSH